VRAGSSEAIARWRYSKGTALCEERLSGVGGGSVSSGKGGVVVEALRDAHKAEFFLCCV
jgi:hypothetical protein